MSPTRITSGPAWFFLPVGTNVKNKQSITAWNGYGDNVLHFTISDSC